MVIRPIDPCCFGQGRRGCAETDNRTIIKEGWHEMRWHLFTETIRDYYYYYYYYFYTSMPSLLARTFER